MRVRKVSVKAGGPHANMCVEEEREREREEEERREREGECVCVEEERVLREGVLREGNRRVPAFRLYDSNLEEQRRSSILPIV
jgi:hypothetical protein